MDEQADGGDYDVSGFQTQGFVIERLAGLAVPAQHAGDFADFFDDGVELGLDSFGVEVVGLGDEAAVCQAADDVGDRLGSLVMCSSVG